MQICLSNRDKKTKTKRGGGEPSMTIKPISKEINAQATNWVLSNVKTTKFSSC